MFFFNCNIYYSTVNNFYCVTNFVIYFDNSIRWFCSNSKCMFISFKINSYSIISNNSMCYGFCLIMFCAAFNRKFSTIIYSYFCCKFTIDFNNSFSWNCYNINSMLFFDQIYFNRFSFFIYDTFLSFGNIMWS